MIQYSTRRTALSRVSPKLKINHVLIFCQNGGINNIIRDGIKY